MIKNETWDLKTALTKVLIVARTKVSSYVINFDVSPFIHLLSKTTTTKQCNVFQ